MARFVFALFMGFVGFIAISIVGIPQLAPLAFVVTIVAAIVANISGDREQSFEGEGCLRTRPIARSTPTHQTSEASAQYFMTRDSNGQTILDLVPGRVVEEYRKSNPQAQPLIQDR